MRVLLGPIGKMPMPRYGSALGYRTLLPAEMPIMKNIRHIARNRKKRNFAIPAAAVATPPNPSNAAASAIIRKITAHRNIVITSLI
jgi:hypothetical protein